jgi:hypothetical protein
VSGSARTTHKGVHWHRDDKGNVSFYDPSTEEWVRWAPGVDAPPLPPRWQILGVPTRVARPGWASPWRIVPAVLIAAAVVVAVLQALLPSGNNTAKEAKASAALLGQCLAREGNRGFSANPVPCSSAKAAVKVVKVVPSNAGSPLCPPGTNGVELPYAGVRYLHIECVSPVPAAG